MRQTEDPEDSLAIPGGAWAVPDEGFDNSEAIQERKRVEGQGVSKCSSVSHSSCPAVSDPVDCRLPGSCGILRAGTLDWVAIYSSKGSSSPRD